MLFYCVQMDRFEIVRKLIATGAQVNSKNIQSCTPLGEQGVFRLQNF
ncbi:hypothetical protein LEP1GSC060_0165 [Leptospira weilii serovar Ranarum str. ICFT]|uniref:Uncharacterized protein n=1 Tax=Leptospira weilii serovar Ranarum str. ICFT TaxID=1218598 RepID=N1WK96_9LEPT|nr:hypothetical protein LEP1GSC060_0165 [Leptospira weilii serovar Ranarum str. ICFT]